MMPNDSRGLDHLMEQNETELDFLSAYGGVDDGQQGDAYALFSAVHRFLVAGGVIAVWWKKPSRFLTVQYGLRMRSVG